MKLEEAIAELEGFNSATFETRFITFSEALKLGIEALKNHRALRRLEILDPDFLLPGETK